MSGIQSERRDSNPRPPLPQSGALPSCATPRILTRVLSYTDAVSIDNRVINYLFFVIAVPSKSTKFLSFTDHKVRSGKRQGDFYDKIWGFPH